MHVIHYANVLFSAAVKPVVVTFLLAFIATSAAPVLLTICRTSSSAIAQRPHDALCLSVVSFKSSIRRVQSSVIGHFGFRSRLATDLPLCTRSSLIFHWLWSDSLIRSGLYGKWTSTHCHKLKTTARSHSSHRSNSQLFAENYDFCLPHLRLTPSLWAYPSEYCHNVWYGKTRMVWLCLFRWVSTEYTNERDGQTDVQTPHNSIDHLCIASCSKNVHFFCIKLVLNSIVEILLMATAE